MPPDDVIEVPYTRLAPETLRAVIEEFVTRDTTDYGICEKTPEEKVADVMLQLERGEAKILYSTFRVAHISDEFSGRGTGHCCDRRSRGATSTRLVRRSGPVVDDHLVRAPPLAIASARERQAAANSVALRADRPVSTGSRFPPATLIDVIEAPGG